MKVGSLFTGISGLDMAVTDFFGAEVRWVSEVEKPLLDRYTVPNLGDVTKVDWSEVEPVDILCGGYPCQPFSHAGQRRGEADPRHLWPHFANALSVLRPRYAVLENVSNHLRLGFDDVLADLAANGFSAEWSLVRASAVGAPHRRERLFVLATHSDIDRRLGRQPRAAQVPGLGERAWLHIGPAGQIPPTDTEGADGRGPQHSPLATSAESTAESRERDRQDRVLWGKFSDAIRRWERILGRPAPAPLAGDELAVSFVEWMMGFPEGWVADLSREDALKALGNAVVPQQAAYALSLLTEADAA